MFFLAAGAVPQWVSDSFPIIRLILIILMVLLSIVMVVAVLIQDSQSGGGMNALSGGSDSGYGQKQTGRTFDGTMKKLTIAIAISLVAVCILFAITQIVYPATMA